MKYLFIILLLFGCKKNDADTTSDSWTSGPGYDNRLTNENTKSLFSTWTDSATGVVIDLSQSSTGNSSFKYKYASGAICACSGLFPDDNFSTTTTFSSCTYVAGSGANTDPGCSSLNSIGMQTYNYVKLYTHVPTQLVICIEGTNTCHTYE